MNALIKKLKKDINFEVNLSNENLKFKTTWGLFSPQKIDDGTKLLLKYLHPKPTDNCLDLGCGYAPIGLWLAKKVPNGIVHMIDKDFVAIDYAIINAKLNHTTNTKIYLSNAFSSVPKEIKFDYIVSNVPAKVGRELLTIILEDAKLHLAKDGQIVLVTINGLRDFMKKNLRSVFGNYKKLKQGAKYTVSKATLE